MGRGNAFLRSEAAVTARLSDGAAGLRAAAPIAIGYFPVAMAFGAAAVKLGLEPVQAIAVSALVFAGASQFLLLTALASGNALPVVVALSGLVNLRHLLYGPILLDRLPQSGYARFLFAFALTDEVFAATLARRSAVPEKFGTAWLLGLGFGAYASWVAGTALGGLLGEAFERDAPMAAEATGFALPALFVAITWLNLSRETALPMAASAAVAAVCAWLGYTTVGLFAGAALACFIHGIRR